MNREAFKLARDTLRKAVKEYGWGRAPRYGSTLTTDKNARFSYRSNPGKFEGEHWSIVHYYEAMTNGCGDEPFTDGEQTVADVFEVSDVERDAFRIKESEHFAILWHSSQGFETLEYVTADRYDRLRERYDNANAESEEES